MNSNNFILQEVIDDLVKAEISLVSPLMKLNYFARLIRNKELVEYTDLELHGYKNHDESVPLYRKTVGVLTIQLQAGGYYHLKELPISMLEPPFNELLKYSKILEGIGVLEQLAKKYEDKDNNELSNRVPMEMLPYIQPAASKLYKSDTTVTVVSAKISTNPNIVIQILNTVRARLLAFTFELGEKFGYNIEISSFKKDQLVNNQTVNNFMKTEIINNGDGNVTNTGNNAQITATINISKNDIEKLNKILREKGIETEDIVELNSILKSEEPDYENKKLGKKANNWILGIVSNTLNGVGKIGIDLSSSILAELIKSYYGISN